MADTSKEQAVQLAREVGTPYVNRHYPGQTSFGFTEESLMNFAKSISKLGRNHALEEAKQALLAEPVVLISKWRTADAIESLKDNTP